MRGRLIVLEGTDGSGKATQAGLLLRSLEEAGIPCREIDFPRYGNPFAEPANLYLHSEGGEARRCQCLRRVRHVRGGPLCLL